MVAPSATLEATTKPCPKSGENVAKKKPKRGRPNSKNPKVDSVAIRLSADLMAAWNAYLESRTPKVTKTAALTTAIEEFLARNGFWPRKDA
jgi:hypothetical protein